MKKQIKYVLIIFFIPILIYILISIKHDDFSNNDKAVLKEEKQDLSEKSDFNLEMEVYKLNKKDVLSDSEVALLIDYLGKINWKKYRDLQKQQGDLGEFNTDELLKRYDFTSKEILYIYEACMNTDGVSGEAFDSLLYDLHKKYPHESAKLYKQHQGYKKLIDLIIENYEYNESLDPSYTKGH